MVVDPNKKRVIDAMACKCLEWEIRDSNAEFISIQNLTQYYEKDGRDSVLSMGGSAVSWLNNVISRAGYEVDNFMMDYDTVRVDLKKREEMEIKEKTSIVMSAYGHPEITQKAINAIQFHTTVPFELIVVNNPHPKDNIAPMLCDMHNNKMIDKLYLNEKNLGDMGALNKGIDIADGDHVCVINNDVIVTEGWLNAMLQVFGYEKNAGLVSGRTNNITGIQVVHGAPSNELFDNNPKLVDMFAKLWGEQHSLGWWQTARLRSMILLIHGGLLSRGARLDERYGMGNYDDDDICVQSMVNGFNNYVADACYVHHYGSLSFLENKEAFKDSLDVNQKAFMEKWADISDMRDKVIEHESKYKGSKQDNISWKLR